MVSRNGVDPLVTQAETFAAVAAPGSDYKVVNWERQADRLKPVRPFITLHPAAGGLHPAGASGSRRPWMMAQRSL